MTTGIAPSVAGDVAILARHAPLEAFLRVGETRVRFDPRRRCPGRGAYVHTACLKRALASGGLARGLRIARSEMDASDLGTTLPDSMDLQGKGASQ